MTTTEKQDLLTYIQDLKMFANAMERDLNQDKKPTKLMLDSTEFAFNQIKLHSK